VCVCVWARARADVHIDMYVDMCIHVHCIQSHVRIHVGTYAYMAYFGHALDMHRNGAQGLHAKHGSKEFTQKGAAARRRLLMLRFAPCFMSPFTPPDMV